MLPRKIAKHRSAKMGRWRIAKTETSSGPLQWQKGVYRTVCMHPARLFHCKLILSAEANSNFLF
jgi:hypothetical protein